MKPPKIVAVDFESSSLNYWEHDFKVLSCAMAWRDESGKLQTKYVEGKEAIAKALPTKTPMVVHNLSFEYGVMFFHFPHAAHLVQVDTMRLVQNYDSGRDGENKRAFKLDKCVKRILPNEPDHKAEAYEWIRSTLGVKPGKEGQYISHLPPDIMERYNIGDAVATLKLYEKLTDEFKAIGYDWNLDHSLYTSITKLISRRRAEGIRVDREGLANHLVKIQAEIEEIDESFKSKLADSIRTVEQQQLDAWINGVKTDKGRAKRAAIAQEQKSRWEFNPKSTKQLAALFVDVMGITPRFTTPKGKPSFKASHLKSWGLGGELLSKRNKRLLVLQQVTSLLALSEKDGRWHVDLKPVAAATSRPAGGGYD